jgi:hypothetical protein
MYIILVNTQKDLRILTISMVRLRTEQGKGLPWLHNWKLAAEPKSRLEPRASDYVTHAE